MHLNPKAFAHATAVVTGVVYIVFYLVSLIAPEAFAFIFNAQFLGADVTSLIPSISFGSFVGILITIAVTGWVIGYLLAHTYNRFLKR